MEEMGLPTFEVSDLEQVRLRESISIYYFDRFKSLNAALL